MGDTTTRIEISRTNKATRDRFRSYKVSVDGAFVTRLKRGETCELIVRVGHRVLEVTVDWAAVSIEFDARPGEIRWFECEPGTDAQESWIPVTPADQYLKLREVRN